MKEYEIAIKSWNSCGEQSNATTRFEEVEIESPDEYLRAKHGVDFPKFSKEVTSTGRLCTCSTMVPLAILTSSPRFSDRNNPIDSPRRLF